VHEREVLVHVHHVGTAGVAQHAEKGLEIAPRQRPARDRDHFVRIARRMRIGAERDHAHLVAALDEKPRYARNVHRRPAEIGREDR
jgi:hypothetical protein